MSPHPDEEELAALEGVMPIHLSDEVFIHDFRNPSVASIEPTSIYSVGKYDENREGMYTQDHFTDDRTLHMGLDIGGPVGTPVHSCLDGEVVISEYHPEDGDYGHLIITEHILRDRRLWILYGHLSSQSIESTPPGSRLAKGQLLGWLGDETENGGWPPHLHLQLSFKAPVNNSVRGVFRLDDREQALLDHPDPQYLIGRLY